MDKDLKKQVDNLRKLSYDEEGSTRIVVPLKQAVKSVEGLHKSHNKKIEDLLERLENYPCCMSCYLTKEEMLAAKALKENFIEIIKEELQ